MSRFSMMARVDTPGEVADAEAWIARYRESLTSIAETGCGCCVRAWQIDGPQELVDTIPLVLSASTEWDRD
ncbi:hypothetical protein [Micromonospora sp. CPCC 205558]|uniref:hypothetical protein n=1 Tax=Micromonospora sp. CPCC 205558 TaxID=3122403 RepID=UPI002FF093A1